LYVNLELTHVRLELLFVQFHCLFVVRFNFPFVCLDHSILCSLFNRSIFLDIHICYSFNSPFVLFGSFDFSIIAIRSIPLFVCLFGSPIFWLVVVRFNFPFVRLDHSILCSLFQSLDFLIICYSFNSPFVLFGSFDSLFIASFFFIRCSLQLPVWFVWIIRFLIIVSIIPFLIFIICLRVSLMRKTSCTVMCNKDLLHAHFLIKKSVCSTKIDDWCPSCE